MFDESIGFIHQILISFMHTIYQLVLQGPTGSRPNFTEEMEKLLIANFSVLDLTLHTGGHVFGPLVYRILRMHRISAATEKLKIFLLRDQMVIFHHA